MDVNQNISNPGTAAPATSKDKAKLEKIMQQLLGLINTKDECIRLYDTLVSEKKDLEASRAPLPPKGGVQLKSSEEVNPKMAHPTRNDTLGSRAHRTNKSAAGNDGNTENGRLRKIEHHRHLSEFKEMFPGGIPDGVSAFIKMNASVVGNKTIPDDVLKRILSFVPTFRKRAYKVLLLGENGVGKDSFVKYVTDKEFTTVVLGLLDAVALNMNTTYGAIEFNIHIPKGMEKFGGLRDAYFLGADCAIIMFDASSRVTFKNVPNWYRDVRRVCENIPIVVCANKARDSKAKSKHIAFLRKKQGRNFNFVELNTKTKHNCEKPFVLFANRLIGECEPRPRILPFSAPYPPLSNNEGSTTYEAVAAGCCIPLPESDDDEL